MSKKQNQKNQKNQKKKSQKSKKSKKKTKKQKKHKILNSNLNPTFDVSKRNHIYVVFEEKHEACHRPKYGCLF